MRFFVFLFGLVLGVAGTLAYAMFFRQPVDVPAPAAVQANAPITVTLGDAFLTGIMQRAALDAPGVEMQKTKMRAELKDDTIVVHAVVDVLGQPTEGTAVLKPVLRNGKLGVDVVRTDFGTITIPAMEQVLETQINTRLASLLDGVTVTGVGIDRLRGVTISADVNLDKVRAPAPSPVQPAARS